MLKNISFFSISNFNLSAQALTDLLETKLFSHCSGQSLVSTGFSPVCRGGGLVLSGKSGLLINFSSEKKVIPSSIVKEAVAERIVSIEESTGVKVGRRQAKEIKEQVIGDLTPRAFGIVKNLLAWINPTKGLIAINTASNATIDLFLTEFFRAVGTDAKIEPIGTEVSPSAAMTNWLVSEESPANFSVDLDCLLKNPSTKAALRFSNHTLEGAAEHVAQGKIPTELAMTWKDRVTFSLGQSGSIKKIKFLDVVTEDVEKSPDPVLQMEADFTLEAYEIESLFADLVDAMGGVCK